MPQPVWLAAAAARTGFLRATFSNVGQATLYLNLNKPAIIIGGRLVFAANAQHMSCENQAFN